MYLEYRRVQRSNNGLAGRPCELQAHVYVYIQAPADVECTHSNTINTLTIKFTCPPFAHTISHECRNLFVQIVYIVYVHVYMHMYMYMHMHMYMYILV